MLAILQRARDYFEQLMTTLPPGAERVVLSILNLHHGLICAIQKQELMDECVRQGIVFSNERQVRLVIVKLRKMGYPICSSSGESGYFMPANLLEYLEFRGREYIKKIKDMRETVDAMDKTIRVIFPGEYEQYQREKAERLGQPALI